MVRHSFFVSNINGQGNVLINRLGNRIKYNLDQPLNLSGEKNWYISLVNCNISNTIPNVDENSNKIVFTRSGTEYTITFQKGKYSIEGLNFEIRRLLKSINSNMEFLLEFDVSTNLMSIVLYSQNIVIITNRSNLLTNLFGFDPSINIQSTINGFYFQAQNPSIFGKNDAILYIMCNLCHSSINNRNESILSAIDIADFLLGSYITLKNTNITKIPINSKNNVQSIEFAILDSRFQETDFSYNAIDGQNALISLQFEITDQ